MKAINRPEVGILPSGKLFDGQEVLIFRMLQDEAGVRNESQVKITTYPRSDFKRINKVLDLNIYNCG